MERIWIVLGGVIGATAVAMAALAAHGLDRLDPVALHQVQGAVQMQGWHALALIGCGAWAGRGGKLGGAKLADAAGFAFAIGTALFCAGVYALALGGVRLPGVAPAGGLLLIGGWLLLAASALSPR